MVPVVMGSPTKRDTQSFRINPPRGYAPVQNNGFLTAPLLILSCFSSAADAGDGAGASAASTGRRTHLARNRGRTFPHLRQTNEQLQRRLPGYATNPPRIEPRAYPPR